MDVAENNPITGYANVTYTLHFYAGSYGQSLRDKATAALNKNIPLFVTEWGSVNADGSGSVATSQANAWKTYLQTNNLRNANWSINDKPKRFRAGGWRKLNRELGRLPVNSSWRLCKGWIWSWPIAFPFRIEAEAYNYMAGGQVNATSDVDGTSNVGYIDVGDWMSYSGTKVQIPTTGTCKISFCVSSASAGEAFTSRKPVDRLTPLSPPQIPEALMPGLSSPRT